MDENLIFGDSDVIEILNRHIVMNPKKVITEFLDALRSWLLRSGHWAATASLTTMTYLLSNKSDLFAVSGRCQQNVDKTSAGLKKQKHVSPPNPAILGPIRTTIMFDSHMIAFPAWSHVLMSAHV